MTTQIPTRRAYGAESASSSVEAVAPQDLKSKPVALALKYWNSIRGARAFPSRDEIAPRGMAPFLRNVVLTRIIDGGRDYEYRIAGEAFVNAFGMHFKGMLLSQIEESDPDYGHATRAIYECVRNLGEPFALRGEVADINARFSSHETVFFPLGQNGIVDHLLAISVFVIRPVDTPVMSLKTVLPRSWQDIGVFFAKGLG